MTSRLPAGALAKGLLAALTLLLPWYARAREAPARSNARVEFEVRLVPAKGERSYKSWDVAVKAPNGGSVFRATKGTGERLRVRDLEPDIYSVCVNGGIGHERCQSFDLTPDPGQARARFRFDFQLPGRSLGSADRRISVKRLGVPLQARAEMERAQRAQGAGDAREFLRRVQAALRIQPDFPEALNNLGVYYHNLQDYAQSIESFRKATAADPDLFAAWVNLGSSLSSAGRLREALEAQLRALSLKPEDAVANAQAAMSCYYLRDYAKAREHFKKVAAVDPASAALPDLYLSQIALALRENTEAERHVLRFLALHPNSPHTPRLRRLAEVLRAGDGAVAGSQ